MLLGRHLYKTWRPLSKIWLRLLRAMSSVRTTTKPSILNWNHSSKSWPNWRPNFKKARIATKRQRFWKQDWSNILKRNSMSSSANWIIESNFKMVVWLNQIRSKIAHSIKKVKQGFHRSIWRIKKLLISLNSKGMFDQSTLKCRFFNVISIVLNKFEVLIQFTRNLKNLLKKFHRISLQNSPPQKSRGKILCGDIFGGLFLKEILNFS